MPIIRSSRVIQMAAAFGTWLYGLLVVGLVWSSGVCVRFAGYCSAVVDQRPINQKAKYHSSSHLYNSKALDDGHNGARNMLNK